MVQFSVIIPVYNGEKYITTTINNLLNQTFDNFEIILINDGSSDNTLEKLMSFENNNKIKIVNYQDNKGVSFARNVGIKNAIGKFLLFLDSDDYLEINCLTDLNEILKDETIDMISFGFVKSNSNLIINYSNKKFDKKYFTNDQFLYNYFTRNIIQCMCSFVCKREIIVNNKILFSEDVYFAEDQEFQIRCNFYSQKIYYISSILFKYNLQETSVMNSKFSLKRLTVLKAFTNLKMLFDNNSNLYMLYVNYFYFNYYGLIKFIVNNENDFELLKQDEKLKVFKNSFRPFLLINKLSVIVNTLYILEKFSPSILKKVLKKSF